MLKRIVLLLIASCGILLATETKNQDPNVTKDELSNIIEQVVTCNEVKMYLHTEIPTRLPIVVAVGRPYNEIEFDANAFGQSIEKASDPSQLKSCLKLKIKSFTKDRLCEVGLDYNPEGIFGTVTLVKEKGKWSVSKAHIFE